MQQLNANGRELLEFIADPANHNLRALQQLWAGHDDTEWSSSPDVYAALAQRILKLGEPLLAYDVVAEGAGFFPHDVQLRQLLALALARSGAAASANALLRELYAEEHRDEETIGLLARTHKDLAREAITIAEARDQLAQAYRFYFEAYELTRGYWSAINAATLALLLDNDDQSKKLAMDVIQECRKRLATGQVPETEQYWLYSTLGEASLLLNDWTAAEEWYGTATHLGAGNWGNLQSTRRNATLIMDYLEVDSRRIDRLFNFPAIVVFTGHMIDRPSRHDARFPPEIEQTVKDALHRRLKSLNAAIGYASAACGADIIFHEVLHELKCESHVVLPYEKELFIKESVDVAPGGNWSERFSNILAGAVEVHEASTQSTTASPILYEFANHILHGLAAMRAAQLGARLVPLAVWDGKKGDGVGGTAATVERWRGLGLNVEIIDIGPMVQQEKLSLKASKTPEVTRVKDVAPTGSAEFHSEIRAMLFADAVGFSKLNDEELPLFVQYFLV